jgi:vacuolar-type H+-ATPase subunit B/Vma2
MDNHEDNFAIVFGAVGIDADTAAFFQQVPSFLLY